MFGEVRHLIYLNSICLVCPGGVGPSRMGGILRTQNLKLIWVWLKIKQEGQTAGVGPCFHLPGFHFGTGFLSHSHISALPGWAKLKQLRWRTSNSFLGRGLLSKNWTE